MKNLLKKIKAWVKTDGLLHIETSALIMCLLAPWIHILLGALITLAIGIGKEIYDKHYGGTPSMHDIICDCIGIVIGLILTIPWIIN